MKVIGVEIKQDRLYLHYVSEHDKIVDQRVAVVQWKKNPVLLRLVKAFAEILSQYLLGDNTNLEKLTGIDLEQLFKDLLDDDTTM